MKITENYQCSFCQRSFETEKSTKNHEVGCNHNPLCRSCTTCKFYLFESYEYKPGKSVSFDSCLKNKDNYKKLKMNCSSYVNKSNEVDKEELKQIASEYNKHKGAEYVLNGTGVTINEAVLHQYKKFLSEIHFEGFLGSVMTGVGDILSVNKSIQESSPTDSYQNVYGHIKTILNSSKTLDFTSSIILTLNGLYREKITKMVNFIADEYEDEPFQPEQFTINGIHLLSATENTLTKAFQMMRKSSLDDANKENSIPLDLLNYDIELTKEILEELEINFQKELSIIKEYCFKAADDYFKIGIPVKNKPILEESDF